MKIKITNNRNGQIENEKVKKIVEFYLDVLVGTRVSEIKEIIITFKSLGYQHGGYIRKKIANNAEYLIVVNSNNTIEQQLETLAHECVHLKQYLFGELVHKREFSSRTGRVKNIKIWKGRTYLRKAYLKRPWEIEARKYQTKLAHNILKKINNPKPVPKPVAVIPKPVANFAGQVLDILKGSELPNGDLVPTLLNGSTDRQKRIQILKKVFALKQDKVIEEVNRNGLVFVRAV